MSDLNACIQAAVEAAVAEALAKVTPGGSTGRAVIIRSRSAGVHVGYLRVRNGQEAELTNARRVWYWTGANTLHEMSLTGVGKGSKISEPVPEITVLKVLEVIPCSPAALATFAAVGWSK